MLSSDRLMQGLCIKLMGSNKKSYAEATRTTHWLDDNNDDYEDSQVIKKLPYFVKDFDELKQIADSLGIPLYIYLHAEQGELNRWRCNDMELQILMWTDSAHLTLKNGIDEGKRLRFTTMPFILTTKVRDI